MDGESKDLLRDWLIRSLEPVCDADPDVLSKYVLALIQNDPKKEGLQDTCVAKLEEFLGDETRGFVSRLFKALESGSYKASNEDDASARRGDDDQQHYAGDDEHSRRRGRANSEDDDDERRRFNKRRRDDDRTRDGPRRDLSRRQPAYAGRGDMRGAGGRGPPSSMGPMGGGRGDPNFGGRRNFAPEWGMPPPQHMGMWQPPHFGPPGAFPMHEFDPSGFNPENPAMGGPPPHMGMMMPRHMGGAPFYPHQGGRGGRGGRGPGHFGGRGGEFGGKDDRDGGSADHNNGYAYGGAAGAKTTLRVSNVDPKYVNMTKLSLHFSKFGNVVNVQMRPSFKCAYVQYATEEEAKKAFHSPIPVCNNRFIEVKWAKYDAKDPQGAPSIAEQSAAESKDGESAATTTAASAPSTSASSTAAESSGADSAATENAASEAGAAEKQMTSEELRAAALEQGRKVLEQKRELLEKQRQLMKQKEELLKRQLTQHKELLERMSQNSDKFSIADKRDLLNKIMALSEDLRALQPRAGAAAAAGLTRSNSGGDSTSDGANIPGLKAELSALEAEASTNSHAAGYGGRGGSAGRWSAGGRGYHRGGGRGGRGGRGYPVHSHTLDNRTTIVKVENLPEAARDTSVLEQHFGNFGAIERVVVDAAAPSRGFIKFQDRYGGQAALTHGSVFGDATLQLAWAEPQDAPAALSQRPDAPAAVTSEGTAEEVPASN